MLKLSSMHATNPTHKKLTVGNKAPDFILPDQSNRPTHFADLLGKGAVVLFFYPKNYSAGCTAEVCGFRDSFEAFKDTGSTVIGISADSAESHEGFAQRYRLPFILLSDAEGLVQKLYGVQKTWGILKERVTYVIDRQGIIRHIFSTQLDIDKHISHALHVIQLLQAAPQGSEQAIIPVSKSDL